MKEEDILLKEFGRKNDFSVPDGFFDSFADKLMDKLPEQDNAHVIDMRAESWWHRLPLRKTAAAVSAIVILGAGAFGLSNLKPHGASHEIISAVQQKDNHSSNAEYSTFDQMADYVMIDNQDCYASLVAEN